MELDAINQQLEYAKQQIKDLRRMAFNMCAAKNAEIMGLQNIIMEMGNGDCKFNCRKNIADTWKSGFLFRERGNFGQTSDEAYTEWRNENE